MNSVDPKILNKLVGIPWLEDGRDYSGTDCTGLMELYCRNVGIKAEAPKISEHRHRSPEEVLHDLDNKNEIVEAEDLQPGDVMIFNIKGELHVALYIGYRKMLHAWCNKTSRISRMNSSWREYFVFAIRAKDGEIYIPPAGDPVTIGLIAGMVIAGGIGAGLGYASGGGWKAMVLGFVGGVLFGIGGAFVGAAIGLALKSERRASDLGSTKYTFGELKTTSTNQVVVPLVYGRVRMPGNIVYQNPIEGGESVDFLVEFARGEIDSFEDIRVNGYEIAELSGCSYHAYIGTATQNIESETGLDLGGVQYRHRACIHFRLVTGEKLKGGNPQFSAVVVGTKVSIWEYNAWTVDKVYSNNPSACIRDYLIRKRQVSGCGYDVNNLEDDTFGEIYDHCKELVSDGNGGTEERFTISYAIDQKRKALDNIAEMLVGFSGSLIISGDYIKLICDRELSSVMSIDVDGENAVRNVVISETAYDEMKNRFGVEYIDPDQNDTRIVAWGAENTVSQDEIGIEQETITVPSIDRATQASRLSNQYFYEMLLNRIAIKFEISLEAAHMEMGDVFNFSYAKQGWVSKPFKCLRIEESEENYFVINAREYNSTIYNDRFGSTIEVFNYGEPTNPNGPVTDVTNVVIEEGEYHTQKDGTITSDIEVSFTAPADQTLFYLSHYQIEIKKGAGSFTVIGTTTNTSYIINNVATEIAYQVRVKTVSINGVISDGTLSNVITVQGKDAPPSDVTGFSYTFESIFVNLNWNNVADKDLAFYEIRTSDENWISGTDNLAYRGLSKPFSFEPESREPGTFYIKAVDTSGICSVNAASVTPVNSEPGTVQNLAVSTAYFNLAKIIWDILTAADIVAYNIYRSDTNAWAGEEVKICTTLGGEAFIEANDPYGGVIMTGSTATEIYDTGIITGCTVGIGDKLTITDGNLVGETVLISGYDSELGKFSLASALSTVPDIGSTFQVRDRAYIKVAAEDGYGEGPKCAAIAVDFVGIDAAALGDKIVSARHMIAGEILTLSAQIRDAIIQSAHILNLSADKITSGTLTALTMILGAGGVLRTNNYSQGVSGVSLSESGIEIWDAIINGDLVLIGNATLRNQYVITEQNAEHDEDTEWEAGIYSKNNVTVNDNDLSLDEGQTSGYYISDKIDINSGDLGIIQWIETIACNSTTNIASGKTFTAGYTGGTLVSNAANCFDENGSTTASWVDGTTKWGQSSHATVDLGEAKTIGKIKLKTGSYGSDNGYIQYSTNGTTWVNVCSANPSCNTLYTYTFPPITAQYWRYISQAFSQGHDGQVCYDFRLYETAVGNITLQTRTSPNSDMSGATSWAPDPAIDNPAGGQMTSDTDAYLQYRINFTRASGSEGTVKLTWIKVSYDSVVAKNSNKLGGFEASTTAAANKIPVMNGSGYIPNEMLNKIPSTALKTSTGSTSSSDLTLQDYCFGINCYAVDYLYNPGGGDPITYYFSILSPNSSSVSDYKHRTRIRAVSSTGGHVGVTSFTGTMLTRYRYITSSDPERWLFIEWDTVNNKISAVWECGDHLTPIANPELDFEVPFTEKEGHAIILVDNSIYKDFTRKEITLGKITEIIHNEYTLDFNSPIKTTFVQRELRYIDIFDELKGDEIRCIERAADSLSAYIPEVDDTGIIKIKRNIITKLPSNVEYRALIKK